MNTFIYNHIAFSDCIKESVSWTTKPLLNTPGGQTIKQKIVYIKSLDILFYCTLYCVFNGNITFSILLIVMLPLNNINSINYTNVSLIKSDKPKVKTPKHGHTEVIQCIVLPLLNFSYHILSD